MGKKKSTEEQQQGIAPSAPPMAQEHYQQSPANPDVNYPSLNSDSTSPQTPTSNTTTPPPTYGSTQDSFQTQTGAYIPQTNQMGPQPTGSGAASNPVDSPPSYNDALNCPAPSYLPYNAPKPAYMAVQNGNQIYPPPISGSGYVIQAPLDATHQGLPQPQRVTTIITTTGVNSCTHCYGGEVHSETDLCCLLCLILFAIFTFPAGLILLCCIPCTTRRRCSRCRRLN